MAFLRAFGSYLPVREVGNEEVGALVGCTPDWIVNVSGIETRRYAAEDESVVDLATAAAESCLGQAGVAAADVGMVIVASGSSERRFPGPAAAVASRLGLIDVPALDLPVASAGTLFGLSLASRLVATYRHVLVVGAEKMSSLVMQEPRERGIAILFGDGAGACLVSREAGGARVLDSLMCSDGAYAEDLKLPHGGPMEMNGRSVILQASRKIPRAIATLLETHGRTAAEVDTFLMHQANQNLITRVAEALGVATERFHSNIRRYGNTSSASMLIAAAEWAQCHGFRPGVPVCFAAFGAGFHWGALLAEGA